MSVSKETMGELAVRRLTERIRSEAVDAAVRVSVLPTIVERGSVRSIRA
jgi:DNA-binding LacI/PurR family transcriptional regulator